MPAQIIVASPSRAGSMWTFNVTRSLVTAAGFEPFPEKVPPDFFPVIQENWGKDLGPNVILCAKTHFRINNFSYAPGKLITPYRDVRDALMSYMRFTRCSFDRALAAAIDMMATVDFYLDNPADNLMPIKYNDITSDPLAVLGRISKFLEFELSESELIKVAEKYSFAQMTTYTKQLGDDSQPADDAEAMNDDGLVSTLNLDGTSRVFDTKTGFQKDHVTSVNKGGWREDLTQAQRDELMNHCADWLQKYDFPL